MVAEINEEIQCSECSKVFFNEDNALEHFGTHSKIENKNQPKNSTEKLAAKEIFGKFSNENVMGTGKEISLNKSIDDLQIQSDEAKPLVCEICSKSFPLQKSLNYHMTSKHSEKNIQCSQCETKFTNDQNLKRHIKRVHEKFQNTHCNICDKRFIK